MNIEKGRNGGGVSFAKQVGLAEWTLGCFNPTKDELGEYLGVDIENETEYVKVTRENETMTTLKFWLENGVYKIPVQFNLVDKIRLNKDETLTQYVNQVGMSTWAATEDELKDWFTHFKAKDGTVTGEKTYRKAYKGEADFYNFMKNLLSNGSDFFSPGTDLLMDTNKIFRGNFKEIQEAIKSEYLGTIMAASVVGTYEKDGETKYSNRIYSSEFLPGYAYNTWKRSGKTANKSIQRFVEQIEKNCRDTYLIDELRDFVPGSTTPKTEEPVGTGDSDY